MRVWRVILYYNLKINFKSPNIALPLHDHTNEIHIARCTGEANSLMTFYTDMYPPSFKSWKLKAKNLKFFKRHEEA